MTAVLVVLLCNAISSTIEASSNQGTGAQTWPIHPAADEPTCHGTCIGSVFSKTMWRASSLVRTYRRDILKPALLPDPVTPGATALCALTIGHLCCCSRYHHSMERPDAVFTPASGFAERRSKRGHCTSFYDLLGNRPEDLAGAQPRCRAWRSRSCRYVRAQLPP